MSSRLRDLERKVDAIERMLRMATETSERAALDIVGAWHEQVFRPPVFGGGKGVTPPNSTDCGIYRLPLRDWTYTRYRFDGVTLDFTATMSYSLITISGVDWHVWRNPCVRYFGFGFNNSVQVSAIASQSCVMPRLHVRQVTTPCPVAYIDPSTSGGSTASSYTESPFELRFGDIDVFS